MYMRIDAGLYQKTPVIDLLNLVKNPAVATAAFWVPFPTVTPASAATPQGVGLGAAGMPDGSPDPSVIAGRTPAGTGISTPIRSTPSVLSIAGGGAETTRSGRGACASAMRRGTTVGALEFATTCQRPWAARRILACAGAIASRAGRHDAQSCARCRWRGQEAAPRGGKLSARRLPQQPAGPSPRDVVPPAPSATSRRARRWRRPGRAHRARGRRAWPHRPSASSRYCGCGRAGARLSSSIRRTGAPRAAARHRRAGPASPPVWSGRPPVPGPSPWR